MRRPRDLPGFEHHSSLGWPFRRATILRALLERPTHSMLGDRRSPGASVAIADIGYFRSAGSKRADGKIAQPQIGETALLPTRNSAQFSGSPDEIIAFFTAMDPSPK